MKAVVFRGIGDIRLEDVPEPRIQEPTDAILRLTASAICGTDLHFVRGTMAGMKPGTILDLTGGIGADRVIDAVGVDAVHAHHGPAAPDSKAREQHREQVRKLVPEPREKDGAWKPGDAPSQALAWAVDCLAKAGSLGIIGVYPPMAETFPIGMAMNKNLTMKMGNCNHRAYVPHLVELVRTGAIDPVGVLTQREPITGAIDAYAAFDRREPGWIKVELRPAAKAA